MLEQIKNLFRRNKLQKIVALISSTLLWFFVMDTQNPIISGSYSVSLTMTNVPRGFRPIYLDQNVTVNLSAPRSYLIDYNSNDIRAFINLKNYSAEGIYEIPVEASFPKGFELESVVPSAIPVQLDPVIEKPILPQIILTGSPAPYSVLKGQKKSSELVTLLGPKISVNNVDRVIGYLDLNNSNRSFDLLVKLSAIDANGRQMNDVRVIPSTINVEVQIESELVQKTVPVNVDINLPAGREILEVNINPQTVEISGLEKSVKDVDSINTESLDFFINTKDFRGKVKLIAPVGVTLSQDEVEVSCKFKD